MYESPDVTIALFRSLIEAGVRQEIARGIARTFSAYRPDDYGRLEQLLQKAGISRPARELALENYRAQTGDLTSPDDENPADPVDAAISRRRRQLDLRLRELEVKRYEQELSEDGGHSHDDRREAALMERIGELESKLEREIHKTELDGLRREFSEQLHELRASLSSHPSSFDEVDLKKYDRRADAETEARALLFRTLDRKLAQTGTGQQLAKEIAARPETVRKITDAIDRVLLSPEEYATQHAGVPVPPTTEDLTAEAERMHQETQALQEQEERPRMIIPSHHEDASPNEEELLETVKKARRDYQDSEKQA